MVFGLNLVFKVFNIRFWNLKVRKFSSNLMIFRVFDLHLSNQFLTYYDVEITYFNFELFKV